MLLRVLLSFVFILNINSLFLEVFPQGAGEQGMPAAGQGVSREGQPPGTAENGQAAGTEGRQEVNKGVSQPPPLLEIKPIEGKNLYSIELRDVGLKDFFRVVAHDYNLNFLIDKDVTGKVTASFTNISLEEALKKIASMNNLVLEKSGDITIIKPNLITKIFTLKHIKAKSLLEAGTGTGEGSSSEGSLSSAGTGANSAAGASPETSSSQTGSSSSQAGSTSSQAGSTSSTGGAGGASGMSEGTGSQQSGKTATIYDFLSDKGKIYLGGQPNSIMVVDYPRNVEKIGAYLKMADKEMMSKIFKLKYISAKEIAGENDTSGDQTSSGTTESGTADSASGGAQ